MIPDLNDDSNWNQNGSSRSMQIDVDKKIMVLLNNGIKVVSCIKIILLRVDLVSQ